MRPDNGASIAYRPNGSRKCWRHRGYRAGVLWGMLLAVGAFTSAHAQTASPAGDGQLPIRRVDAMPNLPQPLQIKNWKGITTHFDRLAFDATARGADMPLLWFDHSGTNFPGDSFGLPSYVGQKPTPGSAEGITCLSAVLSATLVGIDKSHGPHNWILLSEQFFNRANGQKVVLNHPSARTGGSFWYELWPGILFDGIASFYPNVPHTQQIMRTSADRWCAATAAVTDPQGTADFNHTAIDLMTMKPVDNGRWKEPDGAAGVACLEYIAYTRFGDAKYLRAADAAQRSLASSPVNPLYELLLPYGAYTAARMNAEQGRTYDVGKLLNWCFEPGATRPGWGVIVGNWGGDDCDGLAGSVTDGGGYVFAMNTFAMAGALVPLVRYDPRYAHAVGKWMLNAVNAARLFYPDGLPASHQSCAGWTGDPTHSLAYEGLRKHGRGSDAKEQSPYATGDALRSGWAPTDFGVYGSAHVGFFGGIVGQTNSPAILRLDCLKTDFFHQKAYPTFLYYNPYPHAVHVQVDTGPGRADLYDLASHRVVRQSVTGAASFSLASDTAAVIVIMPSSGRRRLSGHLFTVNGITVDFQSKSVTSWKDGKAPP